MYEDLRKAMGDDPMSFTFDELLNWARPLVMVVDHRNKTPEKMEVLQNVCCVDQCLVVPFTNIISKNSHSC
jgi:hypothetical protein